MISSSQIVNEKDDFPDFDVDLVRESTGEANTQLKPHILTIMDYKFKSPRDSMLRPDQRCLIMRNMRWQMVKKCGQSSVCVSLCFCVVMKVYAIEGLHFECFIMLSNFVSR